MRYMTLESAEREALLGELAAMPEFVETMLSALTEEQMLSAGPGGTLSPVEQVWHLADLERRGFGARIARLLTESEPFLPDFDGTQAAIVGNYRARSLTDGLAAFAAERRNLTVFETLDERAWARRGIQKGVGEVALCDIPSFMLQHDAAHRAEIRELLDAMGLPS